MINIEWKNKIRYHHNVITGSKPAFAGTTYIVETRAKKADKKSTKQDIFVPFWGRDAFTQAIAFHEMTEKSLAAIAEVIIASGGYIGISKEITDIVDSVFDHNIATNSALPLGLHAPHEHPFHPL